MVKKKLRLSLDNDTGKPKLIPVHEFPRSMPPRPPIQMTRYAMCRRLMTSDTGDKEKFTVLPESTTDISEERPFSKPDMSRIEFSNVRETSVPRLFSPDPCISMHAATKAHNIAGTDSPLIKENQDTIEQQSLQLEQTSGQKNEDHTMVEKSNNDDVSHINSLPGEMFVKIFSYLTQADLCRIGRVCKKWYIFSRCSVLWKEVDISTRGWKQTRCEEKQLMNFIKMLPPCVTRIKLDIFYKPFYDYEVGLLNFDRFSMNLKIRCPNLHTLMISHVTLLDSLETVIYSCVQFLQNLEILVLHHAKFDFRFAYKPTKENDALISKIKILDLCGCYIKFLSEFPVSKMPYLKILHLGDTDLSDPGFNPDASFLNQLEVLDLRFTWVKEKTLGIIWNHCLHLVELYICDTNIPDEALILCNSEKGLPRLKTICLRRCHHITHEGVTSLIHSCESLQNIYIDPEIYECFLALESFVAYDRLNLDLLKVFDCFDHPCPGNK